MAKKTKLVKTDLDLYVKDKALQDWEKLCDAMTNHDSWPCKDDAYFYTDYDGLGILDDNGEKPTEPKQLTEDFVEALCHKCPLIKECYTFAVSNEEEHGVWGGILFDKRLDNEMLDN